MGKAVASEIFSYSLVNFREYATDKHHTVDDTPYGGGEGMVLKPEPLAAALADLEKKRPVILLSPGGPVFSQDIAKDISKSDGLTFICGRYEGVDQRLIDRFVDQELSLGSFILGGGELAALCVIETVARLLPGVLGNPLSVTRESLEEGRLKFGQYTRPPDWEGEGVPEVLLSGNHKLIEKWRVEQAVIRSAKTPVWRSVAKMI